MNERYDIVIAGAGCAGLSFAWHLLEAGLDGRRVALVDRSFELTADKVWCFWGPETMPFADLADHRWESAVIHTDEVTLDESLEAEPYHCVRSERFREVVLSRLEAAPEVTLVAADIGEIGEDAHGAFVVTSQGTLRSDWVAQSVRYGSADAARTLDYPVRQHFGGLEIKTAEPVFDDERFTMMDFRVPQRDGVAFVYILPFAKDRALVEHTMFSSSPLPKEVHFEATEAYIQERLGVDYVVERREAGSTPMDDRYPSQKSSPRVFNLGTVGGQMKPSTGYAFARIQRHSQALAQGFVDTGRLAVTPPAPARFRFYDLLLLRILHESPRDGVGIFGSLFKQRGVPRVLRFLDERTSLREELALVWRLPWGPFLRGIPRALSRLGQGAEPSTPSSGASGLMMAIGLIALWAVSMVLGVTYQHPGAGQWWADGLWIALQTFLSTGVFITAHDAMHGLITPGRPGINRAVGWLATWSYAGLDYDALARAHHAHHAEPATEHDPDFHRGNPGFISWYIAFMRQYLSWRQFGWLCVLLATMLVALELPVAHVAAFWAAPLILSTFQLFTVGTWLPHRPGSYLGDGPLKARSLDIAPLWSFLACYHFGYHYEHHARPDLPWWRLWRVRGLRQTST